jgi:hypothetical protein
MRTVQGSHFYVLIFSRKVALTRGETGVVLLRFSASNCNIRSLPSPRGTW